MKVTERRGPALFSPFLWHEAPGAFSAVLPEKPGLSTVFFLLQVQTALSAHSQPRPAARCPGGGAAGSRPHIHPYIIHTPAAPAACVCVRVPEGLSCRRTQRERGGDTACVSARVCVYMVDNSWICARDAALCLL